MEARGVGSIHPRPHPSAKLSASTGPPGTAAVLSTSAPAHPNTSSSGVRSRSGSNRPPSAGFNRAKKGEQDQVRIVGDHYVRKRAML